MEETYKLVAKAKMESVASLRVIARRIGVDIEEMGAQALALLKTGAPMLVVTTIIERMQEEIDLALRLALGRSKKRRVTPPLFLLCLLKKPTAFNYNHI